MITTPQVRARLDRVQLVAWVPRNRKPPTIEGFNVKSDTFVRCQTTTQTYARCRQFCSVTSDARIFWQYRPLKPWLGPWKITLVADDRSGLSRADIAKVLRYCCDYRFLIIEVALDFAGSTNVNRRFVSAHAAFGKSHQRTETAETLHYGSRKSGKFVRCYHKRVLGVFRVEVELHSVLLEKVLALPDFRTLPNILYPRHLQFVAPAWERLGQYLTSRFGDQAERMIAEAKRRAASLPRLRSYLTRRGVPNGHRFLVPLEINTNIKRALNDWARRFTRDSA